MATTADPGVTSGTRTPLVALMRRLEGAYVAEFDRRLLDSEFCALSLAHSRNVLRHLGDGPRRASQLVELAGVSKQAISQQLTHLEHNGYVRIEPDATDQRARLVAVTEKGERAQRLVRRTFVEIEHDWAGVLGSEEQMVRLRTDLALLLDATGPVADRAATDPSSC